MANDKVVELLKLKADKNKNRVGSLTGVFKQLVLVVVIISVLLAFLQNKANEINLKAKDIFEGTYLI